MLLVKQKHGYMATSTSTRLYLPVYLETSFELGLVTSWLCLLDLLVY